MKKYIMLQHMNFKEWLLLTEAKKAGDIAKELLGNNPTTINQIQAIIPKDIKQDLQVKLFPIAAYYYQQQKDLNTLKHDFEDYANLVKLNKMPIITIKDDLTIDGEYKSYLHWTQIIHGKKYENQRTSQTIQGDVSDQKFIAQSPDGRIKVYMANSAEQCIILGKGQRFCISQPANTMFQSYRDSKTSTFYFVYDNTRNDDLSIVVVDATQHGIELTDRKNETGKTIQDPYSSQEKRIQSDPNIYFKYLKEHGIDSNIFKNIPKTEKETKEQEKLGNKEENLDWFKSLSPEEKSKYIGRGHELTNEQFDYLYDNNMKFFLTQYVKIGQKVNDYQLDKIVKNKDLKDNYLHNRLIYNQNKIDLSKKEYSLLNPKQQQEFYNVDTDLKFKKALALANLEKVKEALAEGAEIGYAATQASAYGHLDILKYLVEEKGAKIGDFAVNQAAKHGHLDILKYLVEEKSAKIDDFVVNQAATHGHLDILKYIFEKNDKPYYISDNTIDNAKTKEIRDYLFVQRRKQLRKPEFTPIDPKERPPQ